MPHPMYAAAFEQGGEAFENYEECKPPKSITDSNDPALINSWVEGWRRAQKITWCWYIQRNYPGQVVVPCEDCSGRMTEENIRYRDGGFHCGCYEEVYVADDDYRSEQALRYAEKNN